MTNAKTKTRATITRGINCIRLGRLTINHSCKVRLPLMWVTQNRKAVSLICTKYAALRFSATEKGATHRYQLSLEHTIKIDTFSFFVNLPNSYEPPVSVSGDLTSVHAFTVLNCEKQIFIGKKRQNNQAVICPAISVVKLRGLIWPVIGTSRHSPGFWAVTQVRMRAVARLSPPLSLLPTSIIDVYLS